MVSANILETLWEWKRNFEKASDDMIFALDAWDNPRV